MAFLDNLLSIPGASGWLGQLLAGQSSPFLGSVNTGGYTNASPNASFNDRFGNLPPAGPMPTMAAPVLPTPISVGKAPQIAEPYNDALPAAAMPTQYAAPQAAPEAPQVPQLARNNTLANIAQILNPSLQPVFAAQQQAQVQQIMLNELAKQPGMTIPKALAIISNPKVMESAYGNPTQLGELKVGDLSIPTYGQGGNVGYAAPGGVGNIGNLVQMSNEVKRSGAAASKLGEAQGTAQGALPNTLASNDTAIGNIDNLLKDPGLKLAVGPFGISAKIPGSPGADALARLDQVRGEAALAGVAALKGFGRININEFNAARDAIGRLNTSQSYEGIKQALSDLRTVLDNARTRAGEVAGVGPTPRPPTAGSFSQDQLLAEARRRGLVK